jgi:hypothetical protein
LPGASITIKGTKTTTVSEFDGYYQINASQSETLVIACYQTQTILVDKNNKMNINLQPESGSLEEVVVTASGINKEKNH